MATSYYGPEPCELPRATAWYTCPDRAAPPGLLDSPRLARRDRRGLPLPVPVLPPDPLGQRAAAGLPGQGDGRRWQLCHRPPRPEGRPEPRHLAVGRPQVLEQGAGV